MEKYCVKCSDKEGDYFLLAKRLDTYLYGGCFCVCIYACICTSVCVHVHFANFLNENKKIQNIKFKEIWNTLHDTFFLI